MRESPPLLRLISKHRDRVSVAILCINTLVFLLYLRAIQLNLGLGLGRIIIAALATFISIGFVCVTLPEDSQSRNANVVGSSQLRKGEGCVTNPTHVMTNPHHVMVRGFRDLPTTKDQYVGTPEFSCNGHQFSLRVYPGGNHQASEGYVSIFLRHRSKGSITANFELTIIDKFGNKKQSFQTFSAPRFNMWGWKNFILLSEILEESQNILDSDGALKILVSIEDEQSDMFVPKNPLLKTIQQCVFLSEDTADVCFEVCSVEKKEKVSSEFFHAHSLILKECAPMLADLFHFLDDNDGKIATAAITDIKPAVFHNLLWYVYGGIVPEEDLKTHAKDIIEAADKYAIVNLKIEAEAAYEESTTITVDNAIDNLLYAESKNCALLKESVLDFLAENSVEAAQNISFSDVPDHIINDLLVAFGRRQKNNRSKNDKDKYSTMRVSELRRKLYEKGLPVDGTRKMMIEALKANP